MVNSQNERKLKNDTFPEEVKKDLLRSGIPIEEAPKAGWSAPSPTSDIFNELLGFVPSYLNSINHILVFPYYNQKSEIIYNRVKLYPPIEEVKYLSPVKSHPHLYIFPEGWKKLTSPKTKVLIVEGEKKCLKLKLELPQPTDFNYVVIGISGVACWNVEEWGKIDLEGRDAYLGFDADGEDNKEVRREEIKLYAFLKNKGAEVKSLVWQRKEGKGIDDYLASSSQPKEDLRHLIQQAVNPLQKYANRPYVEVTNALKRVEMNARTHEILAEEVKQYIKEGGTLRITSIGKDIRYEEGKQYFSENLADNLFQKVDKIISIHPALDFTDDLAFVGVQLKIPSGEAGTMFHPFWITSNRKNFSKSHFSLDEKNFEVELKGRTLSTEQRWRRENIQKYLFDTTLKPVNGYDLFLEIAVLSEKYNELKNSNYHALVSTWIIGSYFYKIFNAYPFLGFVGPKRTGKSKILDFLRELAFNGLKASSTTQSVMARDIDSLSCTYLIDDAQMKKLMKEENQDFLLLLADSYKRGCKRRISTPYEGGGYITQEFDLYSPKAFGTLKTMDDTLADRTIIIPKFRAITKTGDTYIEDWTEDWASVRDNLYCFALSNFREVRKCYLKERDPSEEFKNRELELWKPLEAVLKTIGARKEIFDGIREIISKSLSQEEGLSSWQESLIYSLFDLTKDKSQEEMEIGTDVIIKKMIDDLEIPKDNPKKPSANWIGKNIKLLDLIIDKKKDSGRRGKHFYKVKYEMVNDRAKRFGLAG